MTTRRIAGLTFNCESPAAYDLEGLPISVYLIKSDGHDGWYICNSDVIMHEKPYRSLEEAAASLNNILMKFRSYRQ